MLETEVKKLIPHIRVIAKKYVNLGVPLEDLIQDGVIGIFKAKKHYDKSLGVNFNIYAIWWIRQAILESLSENSKTVHLPFAKINLFRKIKRVKDMYLQKYGREASELEAKEELQIGNQEYLTTTQSNTISLDKPLDSDENLFLSDLLAGESDIDNDIDRDYYKLVLNKSIKLLTDREQYILVQYFGIDLEKSVGLDEIGKELNLTRERCRQIKQEALIKLKDIVPKFLDL